MLLRGSSVRCQILGHWRLNNPRGGGPLRKALKQKPILFEPFLRAGFRCRLIASFPQAAPASRVASDFVLEMPPVATGPTGAARVASPPTATVNVTRASLAHTAKPVCHCIHFDQEWEYENSASVKSFSQSLALNHHKTLDMKRLFVTGSLTVKLRGFLLVPLPRGEVRFHASLRWYFSQIRSQVLYLHTHKNNHTPSTIYLSWVFAPSVSTVRTLFRSGLFHRYKKKVSGIKHGGAECFEAVMNVNGPHRLVAFHSFLAFSQAAVAPWAAWGLAFFMAPMVRAMGPTKAVPASATTTIWAFVTVMLDSVAPNAKSVWL